MLVEIFICLEFLAIAIFVLSFVKINDYRNWLLTFIATVIFLFLAYQSMALQTENCNALLNESVQVNSSFSTYAYDNSCTVNSYVDTNLSYFNIFFDIMSFLFGLGQIFIKKWGIFK